MSYTRTCEAGGDAAARRLESYRQIADAHALVFHADDGPGIQRYFDIREDALQNLVDMLDPR